MFESLEELWLMWPIRIILSFLGVVLLAVVLRTVIVTIPKIRFRITFKVWPKSFWLTEGEMVQVQVDKKLASLAKTFLNACDIQEEKARRYRRPHQQDLDPIKDLPDYKEITKTVQYWKRRFWSAYELAKKFGFLVRDQAKDYT